MKNKEHFPLFINTKNKEVIIFGGGNIALRRAKTLSQFNFDLTVISPKICDELLKISNIKFIYDTYKPDYIKKPFFVLACTNDKNTNTLIWEFSKKNNILINVCDDKEKCDFYFPSVIINDNITIGLAGDGTSHKKTKETADKIRRLL